MFFPLVFITKSILGPEQDQRRNKRIRRSVSIDPSSSSPLRSRSISHSHLRRSSSPRSPLSEEIGLGQDREEGRVFMEDEMPPKMRKKWIHNAADILKESLQRGERVSVDEVVIAEGGMEIDAERDNDMTSEKQEAIYATREHEAEDIGMDTKAEEVEGNEDIDIEMEPSGHPRPGTLLHAQY